MRGEKRVNILRMWRNWQTRRFQVPVGDRMGSNPFIRTTSVGDSRPLSPTLLFCEQKKGFERSGSRKINATFCFYGNFATEQPTERLFAEPA